MSKSHRFGCDEKYKFLTTLKNHHETGQIQLVYTSFDQFSMTDESFLLESEYIKISVSGIGIHLDNVLTSSLLSLFHCFYA